MSDVVCQPSESEQLQAVTAGQSGHVADVRLFGYARVSTDDQDLSLQIDALTRHGIPKSHIFMDKLSGAKTERPGLSKCLDTLQTGDILVVWRLDRLGRSMRHLITLVEDLRAQRHRVPLAQRRCD